MKKLPFPKHCAISSYQICVDGISNASLKDRYSNAISDYEEWATCYLKLACQARLFSFNLVAKNGNTVIIGDITKDELVKLYEHYMVEKHKHSARQIYDEIKISTKGKCPYCGDIGMSETLDHYLPKSKYPQFSVLPYNLLPCCSDCNKKKSSNVRPEKEQVLHPYFDHDHFFNQQWIKASVYGDNPCHLKYFIDPPSSWSDVDKDRVKTHFDDFKLANKYSVMANEEIALLVDQRKNIMKNHNSEEFIDYLNSIGNSETFFINHWRRIMYQSLAKDTWFCNETF